MQNLIPAGFVIERWYDASPERIFACYASAKEKLAWLACHSNWRYSTFEFREGGREIGQQSRSGDPHPEMTGGLLADGEEVERARGRREERPDRQDEGGEPAGLGPARPGQAPHQPEHGLAEGLSPLEAEEEEETGVREDPVSVVLHRDPKPQ